MQDANSSSARVRLLAGYMRCIKRRSNELTNLCANDAADSGGNHADHNNVGTHSPNYHM